ncbi:MAG: MFS transporter [Sphaerochaetaceae bacterium]|jgi:MFS family permease
MTTKNNSIYKDSNRIKHFLSSLILFGLAYGLLKGVQDNYLAEMVKINEFERGIVEFFRELPGLLLIFILAIMYRFSESKVYKLGLAIALVGSLGLFLFGTGKFIVVFFMVIFSLGEHITMPVKSTISMNLAKEGKSGASLGVMNSLSEAGHIGGFLVVSILFYLLPRFGFEKNSLANFKIVFFIATLLLVAATLVAMAMKDQGVTVQRSRLYFNKKFIKFYGLEMFYGARKQVFITFAPYVLILHYGANTAIISLLLAVSAIFGMLFAPLIGRLIDYMGYKFVMVTDTLILVIVCIFYGFSHHFFAPNVAFIVVCVNYVLDAIISLASIATSVYVQDLTPDTEEIASTLTTGVSVNHFISVIIAFLGGYIWKKTGIELLFTLSAILGIINSIFAASIKVNRDGTLQEG